MKRILTSAVAVLALDQLTKWLVVQTMDLQNVLHIEILPPFLNFRMAWNQGVNFGLFSNNADVLRWVLIALAVVLSIWILLWISKTPGKWAQIFAGFVIGGALGNALDRLIYGAVADFLNVTCCGFNNPYAFNVADVAIFVGAFGLVLFADKRDKNR